MGTFRVTDSIAEFYVVIFDQMFLSMADLLSSDYRLSSL